MSKEAKDESKPKKKRYDVIQILASLLIFFLGLLDSLPLPDHYKTNYLLDELADLPIADQHAVVEPVSLNVVNVQTIFMPSADVLPWHLDDDDPGPVYQNMECRVKGIRIDTSVFTYDLYLDPEFDNNVYESSIFAGDDIPIYDSPTKVNLLDVGTMNDYWSQDPAVITVNTVEITKDDHTAICGQFDSGADAIVTNLLIYLYNYQPYTTRFKCPVRLTGAVGITDIYPLGEGFLYLPAPTPSGYLNVRYFYFPHLTSTLISPQDILNT